MNTELWQDEIDRETAWLLFLYFSRKHPELVKAMREKAEQIVKLRQNVLNLDIDD